MGRTTTYKAFEITEEYKELQTIAGRATIRGYSIRIDPITETVIIVNQPIMNYSEAKEYLLKMENDPEMQIGITSFADPEEEERKAKAEAKRLRKHREPGAPPELKALIRRAKRIYKKSILKGLSSVDSSVKAQSYINRKGTDENKDTAQQALINYISKEYNS